MSGSTQLAHVGFHKGKGKTARGISHMSRLHVAELCASLRPLASNCSSTLKGTRMM